MFTICSISGRDPDSLLEPKNRAAVAKEHRAYAAYLLYETCITEMSAKCNEYTIIINIIIFPLEVIGELIDLGDKIIGFEVDVDFVIEAVADVVVVVVIVVVAVVVVVVVVIVAAVVVVVVV